jgi:hypothetical protein
MARYKVAKVVGSVADERDDDARFRQSGSGALAPARESD